MIYNEPITNTEIDLTNVEVVELVDKNYNKLDNKPSINGVVLQGNKSLEELGIPTQESDPTVPAHVKNITKGDISSWNNKAERGDIPDVSQFITNAVDDLINYYKRSEVYSKTQIDVLIRNINMLHIKKVNELPINDIDPYAIYLLLRSDAEQKDYFEEYIYIENRFELIGTTKISLANYFTKDETRNYVQEQIGLSITKVLDTEV